MIFAAAFAQKLLASAALVAVLWLIVVLIDRHARGQALPFFGEDDGRIRWK